MRGGKPRKRPIRRSAIRRICGQIHHSPRVHCVGNYLSRYARRCGGSFCVGHSRMKWWHCTGCGLTWIDNKADKPACPVVSAHYLPHHFGEVVRIPEPWCHVTHRDQGWENMTDALSTKRALSVNQVYVRSGGPRPCRKCIHVALEEFVASGHVDAVHEGFSRMYRWHK